MAEDREARWLTYRDAARLLGMSPESLRARALAQDAWQRRQGARARAAGYRLHPGPYPRVTKRPCRPTKRVEPSREGLLARITELEARLAATAAELERARAEADRERGERVTERERADRLAGEVTEIAKKLADLTAEAAYVPARRTTVEVLKTALATEKDRNADLRAERDRLSARRSWWPFRRAG